MDGLGLQKEKLSPPRLWRLCKINDFWHERERVMFHNARRVSGDACVPFGAPWWPSKPAHINIYTQNALSLPEWPWLTWAKSCCWGSFFLALPFCWLKHFPNKTGFPVCSTAQMVSDYSFWWCETTPLTRRYQHRARQLNYPAASRRYSRALSAGETRR